MDDGQAPVHRNLTPVLAVGGTVGSSGRGTRESDTSGPAPGGAAVRARGRAGGGGCEGK